MVRESLQQHIAQIPRQSSRPLRVTLDRAKSKMPIHIISTYAPRNGHTEGTERQHWGDVKELLSKTCERHLIVWGADANGQIGNRNHEEGEKYAQKEHSDRRIIGPYAKASETEQGNGARLLRICRRHQMIPMETWKNQELKDETIGNNKNEKKERIGKRNQEKYITTWDSPDGNIRRQYDYIMINAKRRNVARTAQRNIYWRGNMNRHQQHRVQIMQHYYNAAKKYKKPIPADTGERLKYDIRGYSFIMEN